MKISFQQSIQILDTKAIIRFKMDLSFLVKSLKALLPSKRIFIVDAIIIYRGITHSLLQCLQEYSYYSNEFEKPNYAFHPRDNLVSSIPL
jgi:hypothetical protein